MRRWSPDLRTLPSSTVATLSASPTSRRSACLPLNENAEVRAATLSALKRASALISSSAIPSEKNSCSGSLLRLTNGSTAIELCVPTTAGFAVSTDGLGALPDVRGTSMDTEGRHDVGDPRAPARAGVCLGLGADAAGAEAQRGRTARCVDDARHGAAA